ncbi:PREDICTED: F-box/kelch-repeat [Prunus dulcis]|uniref:PREDICTED: F-box/kelch-repeat n=1 Tax=Prunus dulcis TaxID=3755 RepID=A0A5E4EU70_PRUDU|nr:PREDICTED: F-box/kelch-repeat [Prunus dulcis]
MGMGNAQILSCLLPKTLTRFKCVSKWWCALISSPEFVVKHVQHNSDPDNNILSSSSTCTVLLRRLLVDDVVCESRPRTQPRKHIIHGFEDQDTKSVVFSVLNFFCYCCIANSDHCHCTNIDPLRFLSSFEDMDMTNLKQPLIDKEKTFRIVGHCDAIHEAPKLLPPEPYLDVHIAYLRRYRDMSQALGFGYDPKTNDYKVVDSGYPGNEFYGEEIATGSLETETTNLWPEDFQFYLKGMCYWVGHEQSKLVDGLADMLEEDIRDVIISFDKRDEVFHNIMLPLLLSLDATWTKHHAFDLTLTHKPLAFWKSDEILSVSLYGYQPLVSYNLHTKPSSQCLPILGVPKGFAAVIYVPSMVSVLGFRKLHSASTKVL